MSTFDYVEAAADALELLTEFGAAVTLTKQILGEYDPETGTVPSTPLVMTGTGVLLEYSTQEQGVRMAANSLAQINDRKLLLATAGITETPEPSFKVTFGGIGYTIFQVATLAPAGIPVMYEIAVRR